MPYPAHAVLGFPGQFANSQQLAGAQHYYNRYRDYDVNTGRYIQADPIGLAGDDNPYAYAGGNPLRYMDPFGLQWFYNQRTGTMGHVNSDGKVDALFLGNYAGAPGLVNDPSAQDRVGQGPLPRGSYTIGDLTKSRRVGANALRLTPDPSNEMFGRSAFLIHGDNNRRDRSASQGCIIMPKAARLAIARSGDNRLIVYTSPDPRMSVSPKSAKPAAKPNPTARPPVAEKPDWKLPIKPDWFLP